MPSFGKEIGLSKGRAWSGWLNNSLINRIINETERDELWLQQHSNCLRFMKDIEEIHGIDLFLILRIVTVL